jgi:hypothetical protein
MACARCQELAVEIRIRTPSELEKAIRVAQDNLADSTIREVSVSNPHGQSHGQCSFSEVAAGAIWDDVLNYQFECCNCAQKFSLTAETYHGSGGAWQPC